MRRYVVVGNGVAGHRAAVELRRQSPDARITLIGDEAGLPYERPTLTKELLLGSKSEAEIVLKDAAAYAELHIDYRAGVRVEQIEAAARRVTGPGLAVDYDALLLAAGSRPRRLPSALDEGHGIYVRALPDARRLRQALQPGQRVAILGGGFIGLEVAAAARAQGCRVTVVEMRPRLLSRSVPAQVAAFMLALHRAHGVEVHCGEAITGLTWDGNRAEVQLESRRLEADAVVYALGIVPNVELAQRAGLAVADGIVVDGGCRTGDPEIFAAGEVTSHPGGHAGLSRRIESWRVAHDQAVVAATNMAGGSAIYSDAAWLWSDQYDVNLQSLGDVLDAPRYLLRGGFDQPKWTLIALARDGRPIGAIAVNNGREISMLKRVLAAKAGLPEALAAGSRPLEPAEATGI